MTAHLCNYNVSNSVRPDLLPEDCGSPATHYSAWREYRCDYHVAIELERLLICNLCDKPVSHGAVQAIHRERCAYRAQGLDCYCLEGDYACSCIETNYREIEEINQ